MRPAERPAADVRIRRARPADLPQIEGRIRFWAERDVLMAGYTDVMVSQWLTEYVLVPLDLVVLGRKRVPQEGIFWNSVISSLEAHSGEAVTFLE